MGDRYRYPRPRSPVFNPARTSLPINISGWASDHHHDHHDHHLHVVPASRREIISSGSRSSSGSANPSVVTTYKIQADPIPRTSSRTGTRARRSSTLDSSSRPPPIITHANRQLRPIILSGGNRPPSPMRNPYRTSEEEFYTIPASSHGHHRKSYSATMDNADMSRVVRDRDSNRLRIGGGREGTLYVGTSVRPGPTYPPARRSDVDEYGEDGYGYTGPKELVQHDLNNSVPRHHVRRDSNEGGSRRPTSVSGYNDVVPRSYDTRERERGPPPSRRGFDRIPGRAPTWDQAAGRSSVAPLDPVPRPAPFEPIDPVRRTGSARPQSMYHDNRDPRRTGRDDRYEVRDDDRRQPARKDTYDDEVERRGFGVRTDKPERNEQRTDRERNDRRSEKSDQYRRDYRDEDQTEHKSRDVIATGISLAGAALGLTAAKNSISNRDEDREDRKRREYEEESRRRRERDESRDAKERRYREGERDRSPRDFAPPPPPRDRDARDGRDAPPPRDTRDAAPPPRDVPPYAPEPYTNPNRRDNRDRPSSRDGKDVDVDRRRQHPGLSGNAIDDRSDGSDNAAPPRPRRESHARRESTSQQQQGAFNPKDTMDLKALKDALNAKDAQGPPPIPPKEPLTTSRTPRQSVTRDSREVADIRAALDDRRSRELVQTDDRQLRVVSPPREKPEVKPVKGILRQPRPQFPEDPSPIREGVAPLKDAKKDGVPPDARWTKISRKLVSPAALEAGKERYEARDDFVIVLRVLSRDEVQGYAEITQKIRSAREETEAEEKEERRRARRERHERHKRERSDDAPRERRHRRHREHRPGSEEESDTTEDEDDDRVRDAPRMLEGAPRKRAGFVDETLMSGGLGGGK